MWVGVAVRADGEDVVGCDGGADCDELDLGLPARPIYRRNRDSIEVHLTIMFAALAVNHWIETTTGWSIERFVGTAGRYRTITIQAGPHAITTADSVLDDLRDALAKIHNAG